jgi:hypothetical protein
VSVDAGWSERELGQKGPAHAACIPWLGGIAQILDEEKNTVRIGRAMAVRAYRGLDNEELSTGGLW